MIFNAKFLLLAFAAVVAAQSSSVPNGSAGASASGTGSALPVPSGLGLTPCIINCVQPAATKVGCAFTDPACVCVNDQFKADATACLQKTCTPQEVTVAQNLQQMECAAIVPSGASSASGGASTGAAPSGAASSGAAASSGSAGSATNTSPASPPAATSPPAAASPNAALGSTAGGMWALAAGFLGAAAAL